MRILAVREGTERLLLPTPTELPRLLEDREVSIWVHLDGPSSEGERLLSEVFGFHPLLIEDTFADAPTPKVEDKKEYLYLILHGLAEGLASAGSDELLEVETVDLDIYLGERFLITHNRRPLAAIGVVQRQVRRDPELLGRGVALVAHHIIDHMVDEYLPLMERLDAEIDAVEESIVAGEDPKVLSRIFLLKHALQRIRRVALHQKEILNRLWRGDFALIPEWTRPFYRDVYDHFLRVSDLAESYRELAASSLDVHLGMQSHRLNELMKLLTLISMMALPLTFITGLYGMNFDYMPGLHWKYGYEAAWVVMISTAVLMFLYFRRKKWL